MASMNPAPPPIRPSFEDKITQNSTVSPDNIVIREGKKYKVEKQIIQHGTAWKVWQGTQAIFLTIFSLGIGLAFQAWRDAVKNKWHQAITGEETSFIYTRLKRFPPEIQTTTKASQLGTTLQPMKESPKRFEESNLKVEGLETRKTELPQEPLTKSPKIEDIEQTKIEPLKEPLSSLPITVRNFLDAASKDIHKVTLVDLEKGLEEALNVGSEITNPNDKTTIFAILEFVAQHYTFSMMDFDKATELRIRTAQAISPAPPLSKLSKALQTEHPKLGVRLQPIDTSLFKNQTLAVQKRKFTDGTTHLHLDAKISHPARDKLQTTFQWIEANPKKLFDLLPKGFCSGVSVTDENVSYEGRVDAMGKKWAGDFSSDSVNGYRLHGKNASDKVIHFEGIGRVKIGNVYHCHTEYNRISIDLDPNISEEEAPAKLNIIFTALGLGAASSSPREEDIERIKVIQLFRAYYPQQAYGFERNLVSFQQSVEKLKDNIALLVPKMNEKFQEFLVDHPERIYRQEVYPGQYTWAIQGLAKEVKDAGGLGLMHGVFGNDFDDSVGRLINMLRTGILATQDRFQAGIIADGVSCEADLMSGGAESVFTRLITENMPKYPTSYTLSGKMQILCDLDLVERGGFAYRTDLYGTKNPVAYKARPSILELTEHCQKDPQIYKYNEVCIRNRIPPERFKGVLVQDNGQKTAIINALKLEGLITLDTLHRECINGVPVDQFIHVGEFKKEYWA